MHDEKRNDASGSWVYVLFVSLVATLGGLLFGYDTAVISGAIGFLEQFFELTPAMVGWAASSALLGCVLGAACAGTVSDRIGRKKVLIIASICFLVSACMSSAKMGLEGCCDIHDGWQTATKWGLSDEPEWWLGLDTSSLETMSP